MSDAAELHALFLAGFVIAGCGGTTPPVTAPKEKPETAKATSATPAATPDAYAAARAIAHELHSIGDYTKAFPDAEHIAAVNTMGMKTPFDCDPSPCTKEWTKLGQEAGGSGAVIRRNGKLEYVLNAAFEKKLGKIDTPEKAALRLHFYERSTLATCAQIKALGVECAAGSNDAGAAVRKVEGGFEVATYGYVSLCSPPSSGGTDGIKFWTVSPEGALSHTSNALCDLATDVARESLGGKFDCKPGHLGRMFAGFEDLKAAECELEYYLCAQRQEAAAVVAFERLAVELAAHHAPAELIARVRKAVGEERRHTALFRREAGRLFAELGVSPEFPAPNTPDTFAIRSLEEILRENISEGCVNETYSAVVATHQAERAPSEPLRKVFRAIAADERGHAALAHRIHAWGLSVVDEALAEDLQRQLRIESARVHDTVLVTPLGRAMGEPDPSYALIAFDHVARALAA
jgi:hypothetical protein